MSIARGTLYIVATPIGNLGDLGARAREVLATADVIAAEDTRHSGRLLNHLGIATPMLALHEHNEARMVPALLERLATGQRIALVSDAGTPLLSDPGYHLVRAAHQAGHRVSPIPGPSALLAALSAAGLPTDRFAFEGFLPARAAARRKRLEVLAAEPRTLVFFEAPHRLLDTVRDLAAAFGGGREAVLARELTKLYETVHGDRLDALVTWLEANPEQLRGEAVLVVHGAEPPAEQGLDAESARTLAILAAALPPRQAAALAAEITGLKKNFLYQYLVKADDMDADT